MKAETKKVIKILEIFKQYIEESELQWNPDEETETYFLNLIKEIDESVCSLRGEN